MSASVMVRSPMHVIAFLNKYIDWFLGSLQMLFILTNITIIIIIITITIIINERR